MLFFPKQDDAGVKPALFSVLMFFLLTFQGFPREGNIRFGESCLNEHKRFLSLLDCAMPFARDYRALLTGEIGKRPVDVLTIYPERIYYALDRNEVLVENHFGRYCLNLAPGAGAWHREEGSFSPFVRASSFLGALNPFFMSPDGNYSVFLQSGGEEGDFLVFQDRESRETLVLAEGFDLDALKPEVLWSPDSRYFLYSMEDRVYYFSIDQYKAGQVPAPDFRDTGLRDIRCIRWADERHLIVLKDNLVYRILAAELFALSFYREPLQPGRILFRLPISFDPDADTFYPAPGGKRIFWVHRASLAMVLSWEQERYGHSPSLNMEAGFFFQDVQWKDDSSLVFVLKGRGGEDARLMFWDKSRPSLFREAVKGRIARAVLSPDRQVCGVLTENSLDILDAVSFQREASFPVDRGLNVFWVPGGWLCGGEKNISFISHKGDMRLLALSQADHASFSSGGSVVAALGDELFHLGKDGFWKILPPEETLPLGSLQSRDYRLFMDETGRGCFANILFIKDLGLGQNWSPVPRFSGQQEELDWYVETGRAGERRKKVSLVFNAGEQGQNCAGILDILDAYRIKGAFFLSNFFIHACPEETRLLAKSDQSVGVLSSSCFGKEDPSFQSGSRFLEQSLHYSEEAYNRLTGEDMTRIWHSLHYNVNPVLLDISREMSYRYIGSRLYPWESESLTRLMEQVASGDIIPLTLGGKGAGQKALTEERLPRLVEALFNQGYAIVPLEELLENEKF